MLALSDTGRRLCHYMGRVVRVGPWNCGNTKVSFAGSLVRESWVGRGMVNAARRKPGVEGE